MQVINFKREGGVETQWKEHFDSALVFVPSLV